MLRRLLLLQKRQTIPNRQVIRIPEQITILLLLPVEVTASRQLCRIPNHRSRLHCRIRKVRRIPHRSYIVHKAIHRNHSLPQSVELWIKNGIETSRSQTKRIRSVRLDKERQSNGSATKLPVHEQPQQKHLLLKIESQAAALKPKQNVKERPVTVTKEQPQSSKSKEP